MQQIRKINKTEIAIIAYLLKDFQLEFSQEWSKELFVQPMNDGGMGSFKIFRDALNIGTGKKFGKSISEFQFSDDDGVLVVVSLYLDEQNKPFEVSMLNKVCQI